jgi:uncharacterized repeat protein (TIGR03943 family)
MVAAVSDEVRATTVLLVGAMLVKLSIGGAYARYVRAGMGPWILVAGLLLAAVGLVGVVQALRGREAHDHGHEHDHRVGWLLLAPVLALLLVTPPSLGSFGVSRSTGVTVTSGGKVFPNLRGPGPVQVSLLEFDERVADHNGASFVGVPVKLTGFVSKTSDGTGFQIARYQIACCAADAVAYAVRVTGTAGSPPARDQWITVTGIFAKSADGTPELRANGLTEIAAPEDPYE